MSTLKSAKLLLLALLFSAHYVNVSAWLLSQLGLNASYTVRHLSMQLTRVFLSITVEQGARFPTLIEAQWPVSYLPARLAIFPNRAAHALGTAQHDCALLQQAMWSAVDGAGRLWLMDIGCRHVQAVCQPKLLVYDLLRANKELLRIDCSQHIDVTHTQGLVIQLSPSPTTSRAGARHVYFVRANAAYILAYDVATRSWHRRDLVSKMYPELSLHLPVAAVDFSFGRHGELLLADAAGTLYKTLSTPELVAEYSVFDVTHLYLQPFGTLLGRSTGMMTDRLGTLYYVLDKFNAVVRCTQLKNLTTETNEVIFIANRNVQQIFFGTKSEVWVLTEKLLQPHDHCLPGVV